MIIVSKDSDGSIALVASILSNYTPPEGYTAHDLPGWDWSLADLNGVDMSKWDWVNQVMWNGTTIVKRPT